MIDLYPRFNDYIHLFTQSDTETCLKCVVYLLKRLYPIYIKNSLFREIFENELDIR